MFVMYLLNSYINSDEIQEVIKGSGQPVENVKTFSKVILNLMSDAYDS